MGAAVSSEPVSHADLQDKTIRTRKLMDIILQYMLNQVSIKDFATLSNPAECKKYVVFMANNLFQYFHKIRVLPVMDASGFLAFRKMDELQKDQEKMSKEQEAQKQSLCLSLSYFYTRIFQIYGALALTLIDDVQYMGSTGAIKVGTSPFLSTPGTEPQTIARPRSRMGGGGPGRSILGNFYFLDPILDTTLLKTGYTVAHKTYKTSKDEMYFKLTDEKDEKNTVDDIQQGRFAITYPGIPQAARYYITARRVPSTPEIIVTFRELKYTDTNMQDHTVVPDEKVVTDREIRIIPNNAQPPEFVMMKPDYKTRSGEPMKAVNYMIARLDKVLDHVKKSAGTIATSDVSSTATTSSSFDEIGVDPHLSHTRLRANLTTERPPGHCIARALQLLRTPVLSPAEGVSHICKVQFYETSKGLDRGGLPSPGGILTAPSKTSDNKPGSAGLAVFSQLFYDVVGTGTPKLMIGIKKGADGKPSSFEQYTRFMRTMSILFEDNESAPGMTRTDAELQAVGLNRLQNKRDKKKCDSLLLNTDYVIPVSAGVAQEVQKVVLELFKIQFHHAAECGKIMGMLFDIKYDKEKNPIEIVFSSNLLKRGFPELERINYETREVLLKYYARCEGTYKQGMDMVLQDYEKRRTAERQAKTAAKFGLQPQEIKPTSRNATGKLVTPGAEHMAIRPSAPVLGPTAPPAPVLGPAPSAPFLTTPTAAPLFQTAESVPSAKTGPPLLQLRPTLTASQTRRQKAGGKRKRSSHKAVTTTKR